MFIKDLIVEKQKKEGGKSGGLVRNGEFASFSPSDRGGNQCEFLEMKSSNYVAVGLL